MEKIMRLWFAFIILFITICGIGFIIFTIDLFWFLPVAEDKANKECKSQGFDQVKTFNRIGFLSKNPIAIKCEYAEKYTDLGVRT